MWAAGSAGNMPKIAAALPPYVECVTICADRDETGLRFARDAARIIQARKSRSGSKEPAMGKVRDWGDVAVEGGPGAIRIAGDDPATDIPFDAQPNGKTDASPFVNGQPNGGAKPKHFELIPFDAIKIDTTPAYLVKGIVPRVGLCVVWGPPKCGKSFLVFDLMMHVALGREYRGRRVRQGAVVYCALEGCAA